MKSCLKWRAATMVLAGVLSQAGFAAEMFRQHVRIDADWKFAVGEQVNAQATAFDEQAWRTVELPHDWSIEGKTAAENPTGGGGGFFPAGTGWYRRSFEAPLAWRGKRVGVEFEGVYLNSEVWLNGKLLGNHPYGYTSFFFDLTPHLKLGGTNVLAVRVDDSRQKNSRWYSGSGIYRHVWLTVTEPLHVVPWGVWVATPNVSEETALVKVETRLSNEEVREQPLKLQTILIGPDGRVASQSESSGTIDAGKELTLKQEMAVEHPARWSPDTPQLYRAVTRVFSSGKCIDEVETQFGVRSLAWSAEKGLLLNGQALKLCGGCIHHDNGCLGAAAFDRAEERKVQLLKDAGFNALRTSHNPPSPALLNACDRLGVLVLDEAFDCWQKGKNKFDYSVVFDQWWQRDLEAMVLRDRNHPSVVMWSIGNEIPEQFTESGAALARKLADYVRSLDQTRPVTQAICNGPKPDQMTVADQARSALDIMGYNYNLKTHAQDHARVPQRLMVATESFPRETFLYWDYVHSQRYIVGDFVWTAMDYLGESGIGRWCYEGESTKGHGMDTLYPWHGAVCGDLDLDGVRRPVSHYRNIIWGRGEKLHLAVRQPETDKKIQVTPWGLYPAAESWTWTGCEGKTLEVEASSTCEKVQLFLNDKLIGEMPTTRKQQFKAVFKVPYEAGTLRAVGLEDGREVAVCKLTTAGPAAAIRLTTDRTILQADGQDLAFVRVEVVDVNGMLQPNADAMVAFNVSGSGVLMGVQNADLKRSEAAYQASQCRVFHGRALAVVRTTHQPGSVQFTAQAERLAVGQIKLEVQAK